MITRLKRVYYWGVRACMGVSGMMEVTQNLFRARMYVVAFIDIKFLFPLYVVIECGLLVEKINDISISVRTGLSLGLEPSRSL
ncbi:hypothetical protein Tco_0213000 [Tanacetum coccineum]